MRAGRVRHETGAKTGSRESSQSGSKETEEAAVRADETREPPAAIFDPRIALAKLVRSHAHAPAIPSVHFCASVLECRRIP